MSDELGAILSAEAAALRAAAARCRRCGSCQQVCPVFADEERERTSPRGRLQLLDAYLTGELPPSPELAEMLTLCLGCGACAAKCPNGVRAGEVLLASRAGLRAQRRNRTRRRAITAALGRPGLTRMLGALGRGLRPLWARRVPADRGLHLRWTAGKAVRGRRFPPLAKVFLDAWWARADPTPPSPPPRGREGGPDEDAEQVVAIFPGCVSTYLTPEAALGARAALERRGARVELPDGLGCCGLAMFAAGDRKAALRALQRNLEALDPTGYDRIVTPCASCAAMLKEYAPALANELGGEAEQRARGIADKVQVLSQALVEAGTRTGRGLETRGQGISESPPAGGLGASGLTASPQGLAAGHPDRGLSASGEQPEKSAITLTYHLPCHLAHALDDRESGPRALAALSGARYAPAANMDQCCGHGGLFSLDHAAASSRIGARKAAGLLETGAAAVVTECAGCYLQLYDLVGREDPEVEVLWLAEALERYSL